MINIKDRLQFSSSRTEQVLLRNNILAAPDLFEDLMTVYFFGPSRLAQRAAGLICLCLEKNPKLLSPYLPPLLARLREELVPDSVKRNTIRILQFIQIPEAFEEEVMNLCFGYLLSSKEAVAIRVFSMTVLCNLSEKYPEIRNELRILIEDELPFEKAAFVSRGKKILRTLQKE